MTSRFGQQKKKLNEFMEEMRATEQRSANLEQDYRQPRLAMEADVPSDTKTRERTKGAAAAVQAKQAKWSKLNCCTAVHYLALFPSWTVLRTFGFKKLLLLSRV